MKKLCSLLLIGVVISFMVAPASAWVVVPTFGGTGWQTYNYTAGPEGFEGTAGFVVSCSGGLTYNSYLFLDNLSQCGQAGNAGFETGTYGGYALVNLPATSGASIGLVHPGPIDGYLPTEGNYMSAQISQSENTSGFLNFFGNPGTQGSMLETSISLTAGQKFTFDWAFEAGNPFDFSLFYLKDSSGDLIFQEGLAAQAPLPFSVVLFGSGLLGLAGWRRFRKA
jgi:hypothetical protein